MNRQQRRQAARSSKSGPEAADPRMAAAKQAHEAGRHAEAEATYNRLLVENPKNPDALHYKGLLFYQYGRAGEAVALLREAIALRRGVPTFHGNLANVLLHLGDMDGAEAEFRKALRLDKKYVKAYINFSVLLMGRGRLPEAEEMARRALRLQPENAEAYNCLGSILRQQGQRLDAEAAFRRALEINPDYEEAHGNLIFLQDFDPALSFKELQDARRRWAERFMDPLLAGAQPHANSPDPDRKLRIGYVSGDFRNHSAASAFTAVVLERDRENFEAYCYMT
ncbi:MAG: tetratricopeptide repeat protein, partial [Rickettsiales bacterium]